MNQRPSKYEVRSENVKDATIQADKERTIRKFTLL